MRVQSDDFRYALTLKSKIPREFLGEELVFRLF
ncbi:hypothetical protein LSS_09963 [Leptospira santarosai serovar Shermani str. LT 821]|uniref:Uncharacterized protein n=1 Tax=Leptospira santarosai serovar Shermani str. LT 821 TaxID=758847 RepID=K8YBK7_9LEPT|nr:hypothetical protein LSS_09963 [Leptospira santarosai serovar Shermani str. LT 821]